MNELSAGEKIAMPKTVLRTISLEKLRTPSPLTEKQHSISLIIQMSISQTCNIKLPLTSKFIINTKRSLTGSSA